MIGDDQFSVNEEFGANGYELVDPRPDAAEAPYTYFLPSPERLAAIEAGDTAKILVRAQPASQKYDAERMWVTITQAYSEVLEGKLDNIPFDIPSLLAGDSIRLTRNHVIDVIFADAKKETDLTSAPRRQFWDRCIVDQYVLDGMSRVDYIYRETSDMTKRNDRCPDSGWRIRGSEVGIEQDKRSGKTPAYIALGKVLNKDDSWIHLIDEPEGAAFRLDPKTGKFVAVSRNSEV